MVISVVNQKGGTAKTTTVVNLAVALGRNNKKVLVIDLDSQGNLSFCFGIAENGKDVSEWLMEEVLPEKVIQSYNNVDIIPSTISLSDLELTLVNYENRTGFLQKVLAPIRAKYDFIIIDCPPSLSLLTLNALVASDQVLIPTQLSVLGIQGLELILDTIHKVNRNFNHKLQILGVLPVMVDVRRKLTTEVLEHIKVHYEVHVFNTMIRQSVRAMEAPSFTKSVIEYAPKSTTALDYLKFTKEFLKLEKQRTDSEKKH